jgi:hypothetical protein
VVYDTHLTGTTLDLSAEYYHKEEGWGYTEAVATAAVGIHFCDLLRKAIHGIKYQLRVEA